MEVLTALGYILLSYIVYRLGDYLYRKPILFSVTSRRIFITGCDTGFGYELAKRLDSIDCHVYAGCLTKQGAEELKSCCSRRLKTVLLDVTDPKSVRSAYTEVVNMLPPGFGLWGLVNNAGIAGALGPVECLQRKDYQRVFDVNVLGMVDVTTTFLPLIKMCKGRIVNISSIAGLMSFVYTAPYCTAKYGVECFSDTLRRQLKDYGITVHILEPGMFNTNINNLNNYERILRQTWEQSPQEVKEQYGEEFLEQFLDVSIKGFISKAMSNDIHKVIDAYTHALLARYPKARYVLGFDARFIYLSIQQLPEWLSDWLLDTLAKNRPKARVVKNS